MSLASVTRTSSIPSLQPSSSQTSIKGKTIVEDESQQSALTFSQLSGMSDVALSIASDDDHRPRVIRHNEDTEDEEDGIIQPLDQVRIPSPTGHLLGNETQPLLLPAVPTATATDSELQEPFVLSPNIAQDVLTQSNRVMLGALRVERCYVAPTHGNIPCVRQLPTWPPVGPAMVCLSQQSQTGTQKSKKTSEKKTSKRTSPEQHVVVEKKAKTDKPPKPAKVKPEPTPKSPRKRSAKTEADAAPAERTSPDMNAAHVLLGLRTLSSEKLNLPSPPRSEQFHHEDEQVASALISLAQPL